MLTRALFLAAGWFALSFITTVLRGTKVRSGGKIRSLLWLSIVLMAGAIWAALTFGEPAEIFVLTIFTFFFGAFWIWLLPNWNSLGQTLWVTSVLTSVLYVAYSFGVTAFTPLHPIAYVVALALVFIEVAALALGLTYAYESLDVCCRIRWKRLFHPMQPIPGYTPKVSLHVPAYNEPPEVLEATLRSIAQLDYPNYEVLVVDNNTPSEAVWRPLEQICADLGPRFRFLHLDKWPGYKSGALNFALTQTAPDAEIIGIIDADYLVSTVFLRDLVPFFAESRVAFVQTPQAYRDYEGKPYLEACLYGYKYFFAVSMPSRNEHNAIIFAGTMGLMRRAVLQEIGGWDEWCITEDAEASLRVLKRGYQSVFVNRAYGTGLMPYTFDGLKKQRFRWCFGGIQILKKHWESLMPWARWIDPSNRLTLAQRYYYLAGGLQWFNEPLNLCFTLFLITGAIMHFAPGGGMLRPLTSALIVIPAIFLLVGMWRFLWVLRYALRLSYREAILAMANFFSLGWTVTLACIQGLIQPAGVFMRTPKSRSQSDLIRALRAARWETIIGVACLAFAIAVNLANPQPSSLFLGGLLAWQASLYLSALYYSLFSMQVKEPRPQADMRGRPVKESWVVRFALAASAGLLVVLGVSWLLPPPRERPTYAEFQPVEIQVQQLVGLSPVPTDTPTTTMTLPPTLTPPPTFTEIPSLTPGETLPPSPTLAPTLTPFPTETPVIPTLPPPATSTPVPTESPTGTATTTATPSPTPNIF